MQSTPGSERTFIAFFGGVNAGKSSVVNRVTGQNTAIVSNVPGTTTDPVVKSMELLPIGPITVCDTAGLGDETILGGAREEKTRDILRKTDIAVLVADSTRGLTATDEALIERFKENKTPYIVCYNKSDLCAVRITKSNELSVSALTGEGIEELKEKLAAYAVQNDRTIVGDLFAAGDVVVLVTPIDEAAPKGRLILPQQLVLRELLDLHALPLVVQDGELKKALAVLGEPPKAVITDSQVFAKIKETVPRDVYLTSFSILMQRYKGVLKGALKGVSALDRLKDADTVLISEGCTHHRQCGDIGTVKLPAMIRKYTDKDVRFVFTSGGEFPKDLSPYALVLHCGGCMLNEREMRFRADEAARQGVPFGNYGLAMAKMNGILERSTEILREKKL